MCQVTFRCEVITPMFMSGADGRTPELRPSEFKGMMRFWWRAAKAEDNIEKLRKEEAKIFGGTGEGEGKSKVWIRITNLFPPSQEIGNDIRNELGEYDGLKYLLYSTFALKVRQEPLIRKYIKPGYNFDVVLTSKEDENCYKQALASFWLAIYLGGFGTRAKRGGGNISVKGVEGDSYGIDFIPKGNNKSEIKNWLDYNLKKISSIIPPSGTKKYSNLKDSQILVFDPKKNSWQEALDFLGKIFKDFRLLNKSDLWNMSAFGMPVMHNNFRIRMVPYKDSKRLSERMGSPVIIKVIKSDTLYFPLIIKLSCDIGLVGKEEKIEREWKEANERNIKPVNFAKINRFINSIKRDAEEVIL